MDAPSHTGAHDPLDLIGGEGRAASQLTIEDYFLLAALAGAGPGEWVEVTVHADGSFDWRYA